jgi:hypothetical protein
MPLGSATGLVRRSPVSRGRSCHPRARRDVWGVRARGDAHAAPGASESTPWSGETTPAPPTTGHEAHSMKLVLARTAANLECAGIVLCGGTDTGTA